MFKNDNYVPQTLDNPLRWMGVPADSMIIFFIVWMALMMFNHTIIGIISGFMSAFFYSKYRTRSVVRKCFRFSYWYLPCEIIRTKGVPGHVRTMRI